jgi:queuine/archaeosine tRNA-ribosyltransferase
MSAREKKSIKKLYLGWAPARDNPQPWINFKISHLMINALDFWERRQTLAPVSQTLSYRGEVFCDSGGYQALSRAIKPLPLEVLDMQRQLRANINAVLDDPQDPERHIRNLKIYAAATAEDEKQSFVPVIPCDLSLRFLSKIASIWPAPALVAVGKVVPQLFPLSDLSKILYVIKRLQEIKRIYSQSKVHVFGLGGFATAAIFFSIIDSTDSSNWIHDARFGRIRTLGGGFVRPDRPRSRAAFLEQGPCKCPACKDYGPDILNIVGTRGFRLRAIHNAWVLTKEMELLNESLFSDKYWDFVEKRVAKSNWHKRLLANVLKLTKG